MLRLSFLFSVFMLQFFLTSGKAHSADLIPAEDLDIRTEDGIEMIYDKKGELFTGAVVLPDENKRNMTYFYIDGQKNGVAISRYDANHVELAITYRNGAKNGDEVMFYSNGNRQYKRTYVDNILNGEEILFYENDKPKQVNHYKDGILDGEVQYFDMNGERTKIENYKDGILHGFVHIIENNTLIEENQYVDGKLEGITKKYNEKYLTDEISYHNDVREGIHKIYHSNGSITEIPYHNDKKNGVATAYYPNRKVAQKLVYTNDQKNGISLKFYPNELLAAAENFKNDKLNGIARYFDKDGLLTSVKNFADGTALYTIDLAKDEPLNKIYEAYQKGNLTHYSNKRNLWYYLLWLAINTNSEDMLQRLETEMQMYALSVDDLKVYQKYDSSNFSRLHKELFFGLTPFAYGVNIAAPSEILQKFVSQIDIPSDNKSTPLHDAVRLNNAEMVKYLILQHADLEAKDNQGNTALFAALKHHALPEITVMLIDAAANVNTDDKKGESPLSFAIEHNAPADIVVSLVNAGANVNLALCSAEDLLLRAVKTKKPAEVIEALLKSKMISKNPDEDGHTVLFYAIHNGYPLSVIQDLIKSEDTLLENSAADILPEIIRQNNLELLETLDIPLSNDIDGHGHNALWLAYENDAPQEILDYFWNEGVAAFGIKYLDTDDDNKSESLLISALKKNDTEMAQKLLDAGVSVNGAATKESALTYVLTHPADQQITLAILEKSSADALRGNIPETNQPIWKYLLNKRKFTELKIVFEKIKDVQVLKDENGKTPLDIVMEYPNDKEQLAVIFPYIQQTEQNLVWQALKTENTALLESVLQRTADLRTLTKDGENLLTYIVKNDLNPEMIDILHKYHFNFDQVNHDGETALDLACATKNLRQAKQLVANGANPNRIVHTRSYLMNLNYDDDGLTELFLTNKANITHTAQMGETTLMAAVKNLNIKLIEYLLEQDVIVDQTDYDGNTALMYLTDAVATYKSLPEDFLFARIRAITELLINKGADINHRNSSGETLLILLAKKTPDSYGKVADIFYSFGADGNMKDQAGRTAKDYISAKK